MPQLAHGQPKGLGLGPGRLAAEAAALVALRRSAVSAPGSGSGSPPGPPAAHGAEPAGNEETELEMAPATSPLAVSASAAVPQTLDDDPGSEPAAAADDDASDEWHEADDSGHSAQLAESQIWHEAGETSQAAVVFPAQEAAAGAALPVQSQSWQGVAAGAPRGMPGAAAQGRAEAHAGAGESQIWHDAAAQGGSLEWQGAPGAAAQARRLPAAAAVRCRDEAEEAEDANPAADDSSGTEDEVAGQGPGGDPDPAAADSFGTEAEGAGGDPGPAASASHGTEDEAVGEDLGPDPDGVPERRAGRVGCGVVVVAADDEDEDAVSGAPNSLSHP